MTEKEAKATVLATIEVMAEQIEILTEERNGFREQLEVQRKLVLELQEKNRELKDEVAESLHSMNEYILLIANRDLKIKEQGEEIDILKKFMETSEEVISDYKREIERLKEDFEKLKSFAKEAVDNSQEIYDAYYKAVGKMYPDKRKITL